MIARRYWIGLFLCQRRFREEDALEWDWQNEVIKISQLPFEEF